MKAKEIIINDILKELESGVVPWHKPWFAIGKCNLQSGHVYKGINQLLLASTEDEFYLTFKQIQELNGSLKAGSHGKHICFWNWFNEVDTAGNLTGKQIPSVKYYTVFGLSLIELPEDVKEKLISKRRAEMKDNKINMDVEEFIAATRAILRHEDQVRAFYSPTFDYINMPKLGQFENSDLYYKTLFHELTHWTGHKSRCDRGLEKNAAFGSESYAKEELIAEIGSALLAFEFDIDMETKNTASYIHGWQQKIKSDSNFIFSAASKSEKAIEHLKKIVK